jgi:superfamily II DNA or RNA helicase
MRIVLCNGLELYDIPNDLRQDLKQRLTFDNPKWLENDRLGRWNRGTPKVLRFYDVSDRGSMAIPRGYLRQLLLLCRDRGLSPVVEDRRRRLAEVGFSFHGNLKPFQEKAVAAMLARDFGTLSAPTGAGKTVMALAIIARRRQPTLIVVHTRDLARQWVDRIAFFLRMPEDRIGLIGGGKSRPGSGITVAMVQSLYKQAEQAARHTGFLIVDECHRCPSRTFTEAVKAFDSFYMMGLSATPFRRDSLSRLIFWHLGDVHHEVDKRMLVVGGDLLAAEVVWRPTDFVSHFDPLTEYSQMLAELTTNDERNRAIAADVATEAAQGQGVCLVLSDRKKQCEILQFLLTYKHHLKCEKLTGDMPETRRRQVIETVNQGCCQVLVATGQLIGEGFDCRNLTCLFLATPIRFSGRLIQYLGRVLRPAPGKGRAKVYDYVDGAVDVLAAAARARRRVYTQ